MAHLADESETQVLRLDFDRRLKLEFHGTKITSDAGLFAFRDLDEVLGLAEIAGDKLADQIRHALSSSPRLIAAHAAGSTSACRVQSDPLDTRDLIGIDHVFHV
ncbi:Protein of unknown function [Magnetospira sp. QH-2]|nr:Protein of unknown function [Magnetospira sp. QH-2]